MKKTNSEIAELNFQKALKIAYNDDGTIDTNYWKTEWNANGFLYLTIGKNNIFHLLVPNSLEHILDEMATGKYVVITTGKSSRSKALSMGVLLEDNVEMIELMFEDKTDSPFCSHISITQCTYKIGADFNRVKTTLKIYTEYEEMEFDLYIRSGKEYVLPYLKPIDIKTFNNIK